MFFSEVFLLVEGIVPRAQVRVKNGGGGGHVGVFNVPGEGGKFGEVVTLKCSSCPVEEENLVRWSRWSVQRARWRRKRLEVVTQECSSCPVKEKKVEGGHVGVFIVPGGGRKVVRRSRRRVQRARWRRKIW